MTFTDAAVEPLQSGLSLDIEPGGFLAVLGPNDAGKSMLLTTALNTWRLTYGSIKVDGNLGYIPRQRMFRPSLPTRIRDLVELVASKNRSATEEMLEFAGASNIADCRVGTLSGGQQQLAHQAQALVSAPDFLPCDEPPFSLNPAAQRTTVEHLDRHRRENNTAVVFITHDINPILDVYDRMLYPAPHGHAVGSVEEITASETLSELYQTEVVVARIKGKLVIA